MTWRPTEPAGSTSIPIGAQYIRENWVQIAAVLTTTRLTAGTEIPDFVPSGEAIWFYADSAPTGYTIVSGSSDELLAVKGGSTYTTGGAQAGTWQQTDVTLTAAQIPPHTHTVPFPVQANSGSGPAIYVNNDGENVTGSAVTSGGSASAHNHGATWRPLARVGLVCSKDA
ncbi:hypothetical protein OAF54_02110 [bacterium]|nr:hypothetical protein [bacterium]